MSKHRTTLTVVMFVLLTAVSLAAAVQAVVLGIPESPHPDRSPLVMLLATRDVIDQPPRSRLNVARQLERELARNVDWFGEFEKLDAAQRATFVDNVEELARSAYLDRARRYSAIKDPRKREQYVDRQIQTVLSWAALLDENLQSHQKPVLGAAAVLTLAERIKQWHSRADAQQQQWMDAFQGALAQRYFARLRSGMGINQQ